MPTGRIYINARREETLYACGVAVGYGLL